MSNQEYNDDFSDSDQNYARDQRDDDEQHTQKVNGQMESLQGRVEQLQKELLVEKKNHELTKSRLEGEITRVKEEKMMANESTKLSVPAPVGYSAKIKSELVKFCIHNSLEAVYEDNEINDEACIAILKAASKKIKETAHRPVTEDSMKRVASTVIVSDPEAKLQARIKSLEYELRLALGAAEDIRALKAKLTQAMERIRTEKEHKLTAEQELTDSLKKTDMLSDHIEKMMIYLKHEAAAKIRTMEQLRVSERANERIKEKCELISRKSAAKDRLVIELREGSKILEDQLRLMDEKYLELRSKLDWARDQAGKKLKRAEKMAADLRVKFALAGNSTLLDNMPLPDIYSNNGSGMMGGERSMSGPPSYSGAQGGLGTLDAGVSQYTEAFSTSTRRSRKGKKGRANHLSPLGQQEEEPNLDVVLEKIRLQQGAKRDWSEDKLKNLTNSR